MADGYTDVRTEVTSGDPTRQSAALVAILGMLAAGRDASAHVSLTCHALLGNANVAPAIRSVGYDLVRAATLADGDWGYAAAGITADLQKGAAPEMRVKALGLLPCLPAHHLTALLGKEAVRVRLSAALHNATSAVRAAAIVAVAQVSAGDAAPAAAAQDDLLAGLLKEGVMSACEGLTEDAADVVAASCTSLAALLRGAAAGTAASGRVSSAQQAAEAAAAARLRAALAASAMQRLQSLWGVALSRFRTLGCGWQLEVPPLLVAHLRALQRPGEVRPLDALPGDSAAVGGTSRAHLFDESAALLGEFVRGVDPGVAAAAAEALFEMAQASD